MMVGVGPGLSGIVGSVDSCGVGMSVAEGSSVGTADGKSESPYKISVGTLDGVSDSNVHKISDGIEEGTPESKS